jgi:hypothetical protein
METARNSYDIQAKFKDGIYNSENNTRGRIIKVSIVNL